MFNLPIGLQASK